MKIVVTAVGSSLDDQVETRFGRAPYFIFFDTETTDFEAVQNPNMSAGGGAGIKSAQLMSDRGVKYVLTGNCGPNAFNVFGTAGIQVILGVAGTVRHAIEQFKAGALSSSNQPNVANKFGMGGGMGGGRGMGTGSGMGGGRGMGMGQNTERQGDQTEKTVESHRLTLKSVVAVEFVSIIAPWARLSWMMWHQSIKINAPGAENVLIVVLLRR